MTNNFDDFDVPPPEADGFDEPVRSQPAPSQGGLSNLKSAWQSKPFFKVIVIVIGVGAVATAALGLLSGPKDVAKSQVGNAPTLSVAPGGEASPAYQDAVMDASRQWAEQARNQGGSSLPIPIGGDEKVNVDGPPATPEDPLAEYRLQTEQLQRQQQQQAMTEQQRQQQAQLAQQRAQQEQQQNDMMARAMQQQMQSLVGAWTPKAMSIVKVSDGAGTTGNGGTGTNGINGANGTLAEQDRAKSTVKTLIAAGTVSYAQLMTEANSDVQAPILAQILSGPLQGARAIGSFQVASDEYLVLKFTTATLRKKEYSIDAIALDPETTLGGLVTESDQRYFSRIVVPAAASFVAGFGNSLSNETKVTTNGNTTVSEKSAGSVREGLAQGIGSAGQKVSDLMTQEAAKIKPLVRVAVGTSMGLLFVHSVTEAKAQ
jgi:intracellular multiplication protein IcmE